MQRLFWIVFVVACGSSSSENNPMPDSGSGTSGGGQHVTECTGVVQTGSPSNCPYGDCSENGGDHCTKYASWVPGNASGLCTAGETGTYGLLFQDSKGGSFYEVVQCTNGSPTQHACTSGYSTVANGYDGNPGYKCL